MVLYQFRMSLRGTTLKETPEPLIGEPSPSLDFHSFHPMFSSSEISRWFCAWGKEEARERLDVKICDPFQIRAGMMIKPCQDG